MDQRAGFSYEFDQNGEYELIAACVAFSAETSDEFTVFDVGANTGEWTENAIRLSHGVEASYHVFEVSEAMNDTLMARFGSEKFSNVYLNRVALSDSEGEIHFKRFPNSETVNTLLVESNSFAHLPHRIESAHSTTGDIYCANTGVSHIDLLKLDTEGWEWPVLQGFADMLRDHMVSVVQFEYGYTHADLHKLMGDFFRFFEDLGYVVGPLRKTGVNFRSFKYSDNDFKSGPNYVAALPEVAGFLRIFP